MNSDIQVICFLEYLAKGPCYSHELIRDGMDVPYELIQLLERHGFIVNMKYNEKSSAAYRTLKTSVFKLRLLPDGYRFLNHQKACSA